MRENSEKSGNEIVREVDTSEDWVGGHSDESGPCQACAVGDIDSDRQYGDFLIFKANTMS